MERRLDHVWCGLFLNGLRQHHAALLAVGVGIDAGDIINFLEASILESPAHVSGIGNLLWDWNIADGAFPNALVRHVRSAGGPRWIYMIRRINYPRLM